MKMKLLGSKSILLLFLSLYNTSVVHTLKLQLISPDNTATYKGDSDRELREIPKNHHERPEKPPRSSYNGPYPDEDKPLVRPTSTADDDYEESFTSAHQFVINGFKTEEELASCCRNDLIKAIDSVLQNIIDDLGQNRKLNEQSGLTRSLSSSSKVAYLSFTTLNSKSFTILLIFISQHSIISTHICSHIWCNT